MYLEECGENSIKNAEISHTSRWKAAVIQPCCSGVWRLCGGCKVVTQQVGLQYSHTGYRVPEIWPNEAVIGGGRSAYFSHLLSVSILLFHSIPSFLPVYSMYDIQQAHSPQKHMQCHQNNSSLCSKHCRCVCKVHTKTTTQRVHVVRREDRRADGLLCQPAEMRRCQYCTGMQPGRGDHQKDSERLIPGCAHDEDVYLLREDVPW